MTEPSPPAASRRWAVATIVTAVIAAISVAVYVTDLLETSVTTWLAPRIWQLLIYLLAIASAAFANRWNAETVRATIRQEAAANRLAARREGVALRSYIDRQVSETARRMDARLARITKGMDHAGIQIEENTGELRRIGGEYEMTGYSRGYADGRAGTRPNPDTPTGLDPAVLDMGNRIARRLTDDR